MAQVLAEKFGGIDILVNNAARPAFPQYFVPIAGPANVAKNIINTRGTHPRRKIAIHRALSNQTRRRQSLGDLNSKVRLPDHRRFISRFRPWVSMCVPHGVRRRREQGIVWPAWAALSATHLTCTVRYL